MKRKDAPHRMTPKLIESLRSYRREDLFFDLIAGLTVGLVALPLAMAFAISSGVPPEAGIYTAVIAGFVVSALGGSRSQIAGPTGAFVVIVAGIATKFGMSGLLTCTLMAGAILVVMGLTGLGAAVRYIPRPVTIGFTNGIAILIASTQVKDFLGLTIDHVPVDFLERMRELASHLRTVNPQVLTIALASLLIVLLWPRVTKRVPGTIVALLIATAWCAVLGVNVETIGSKFGGIPTGLPKISIPEVRLDLIMPLLPSALTVAMLAAIESLLSAVVADNMSGDRHKPDVELVAQGIANLVVPMFGGIPATGAIARTATNIRSGAKSPIAGIVHSLTLLVILLFAAPLARFIPLATLAAILLIVAYNMGEWREIGAIIRSSWTDRLVWAATFGLTVFADLTVAVEVGMVLAAILYIRQVTETTSVEPVTDEYIRDGKPHVLQDKLIPPYVTILRIHGPFLFGASKKLEEATADLSRFGRVIILRLRNMTAIDGTGVHALEAFARRIQTAGNSLVLCGARKQPAKLIRHSELPHLIGRDSIVPHVDAALRRAEAIFGGFNGVGEHLAKELSNNPI
ncbi:MAG: SulP family inorganic anion transporter [Gemmataceae bacterium]